ncbi:hypothetical protein EG240_11950 [Paenimyroides tangerinum]|uniref:Lipoprotein n=1 Tax=Paenimyroides tangerinum TaxID=2488728 RepID=A0A3P3W3M9_9FLAO|nr:hypothetical protein [Paenimyroides tangerinum]RRJ89344.1 hypothetical protein EG240_11950 [Paenimyroides tangerinum]
MNKILTILMLLTLFSCNNIKTESSNQSKSTIINQVDSKNKFDSLINYEFGLSCGTECAVVFIVKKIESFNSASIQVNFQIEKYENYELKQTSSANYIFNYGNINTIQYINDEGKTENINTIFQGQALETFKGFGNKLFELNSK